MPVVDAAWETWLQTNASRGCTLDSMVDAMVGAGFPPATAGAVVQAALIRHAGGGVEAAAPSLATEPAVAAAAHAIASAYEYDAMPIAEGNVIHAHDRDVKVVLRCERPQVVVFADVLSADECDQMIERSRNRMKRSTIVDPATGKEDVILNRTSEGIWYQRGEDELIERLDARIAALMNWPVENGEGLQILHYGATGEYRPHYDYFPPDQSGSAVHTAHGGQRVATLIVYLNDVADGGDTIFPDAGMSVAARKGNAVYFRYLNGQRQLDPLTLHGGAPVVSGDKWIMTKWVRERAYV